MSIINRLVNFFLATLFSFERIVNRINVLCFIFFLPFPIPSVGYILNIFFFCNLWSDLVVIKISQYTCNLAVPSFRNLNLVKICLLQSLLIYRWIGFVWSIMIALCFPLRVKRDFEEDFYQVEEGIWLSGRLFKCWIIVKEKSFATYYKKMINIKLL